MVSFSQKVGGISQKTVSVVCLQHFCPSLTFRFVFFPTAAPSVVCNPTSILHPIDPCTKDYCCYKEVGMADKYQNKSVTKTTGVKCSDSSMLKNDTNVTSTCQEQCNGKCKAGEKRVFMGSVCCACVALVYSACTYTLFLFMMNSGYANADFVQIC